MDRFKIEHFEQRHGLPLPQVRALSREECEAVSRRLRSRLNVSPATDLLSVIRHLDQQERFVSDEAADSPSFDLGRVLPVTSRNQKLYVNWYRFDDIDEIDADTLVTFFDDFWYVGSDDLDIFDADLSWIVSVRHDGALKRVIFSREPATP